MPAVTVAPAHQARTDLFTIAERGINAASAFNGTPIDISDYEGLLTVSVAFIAATGAQTGIAKLQTGDVSNGSDAADYAPTGGGAVAFTTFTQSDLTKMFHKVYDTNGMKRYVRLVITAAGSTPAISAAAFVTGSKKAQ
jgi:hypothetical protein